MQRLVVILSVLFYVVLAWIPFSRSQLWRNAGKSPATTEQMDQREKSVSNVPATLKDQEGRRKIRWAFNSFDLYSGLTRNEIANLAEDYRTHSLGFLVLLVCLILANVLRRSRP